MLLRCRGSTSSRSLWAGSGRAPQRQRPLPGPQPLWLLRLLWLALLPPRRPSQPRGAAGAASGARIARAGAPDCGSQYLSIALPGGAPRLRSCRLRLKELLAIQSTPKVSPLLPTSHSRHHVTAAELGWGWRAGKAGTVHVPTPFLAPSSPASSRPRTGNRGGDRECSFPRWGGWRPLKREKGTPGAAAAGGTLTEGPARWGRKTKFPEGPLAVGAHYLRPLRSGAGQIPAADGSQQQGPVQKNWGWGRAPVHLANLHTC